MLFSCQHENGEDKLSRQEHLDEQTLRNRGIASERCAHIDLTLVREHASNQSSGSNTTKDLDKEEEEATNPWQRADQTHTKGHGLI